MTVTKIKEDLSERLKLNNMTPQEYLESKLKDQTLTSDSDERKALTERRKEVEKILRDTFTDSSPTIRYGGSISKGTMIKASYDLDIICYFPHGDDEPGSSLKTIYESVESALSPTYYVERKTSALRLRSRDTQDFWTDFHIDIVPGRFTDDKKEDAYLHRATGAKKYLKTNLQMHIDHVKDSGLTCVLQLVKFWKVRNGLTTRNFVLELMVIEVLKSSRSKDKLDKCLTTLWEKLRDDIDSITIEDPANPTGNDLSDIWDTTVKQNLKYAATTTLQIIEQSGWDTVFGKVETVTDSQKSAAIIRSAATISNPAKPWGKL
jgi:hypothetical protein